MDFRHLSVFFLLIASHSSAQPYCADPGTVEHEIKISSDSGGFTGDLSVSANFGLALSAAGDLDGNGVGDLIAGAPRENGDLGGNDVGGIWILFLEHEGGYQVSDQSLITERVDTPLQLDNFDRFGSAVAYLGDGDFDGVTEVAVGAPGTDGEGDGAGAVWMLGIDATGSVVRAHPLSGFEGSLDAGDQFGCSLASPGDLDGNGAPDLIIGALGDDDGGSNRGAIWIALMEYQVSGELTVLTTQKVSESEGGFTGPLKNGDEMGSSVAALGDLDGDGKQDIAVGAWRDPAGGTERGAVWLMFLDHDSSGSVEVVNHSKISAINGGFGGSVSNFDYFGVSIAVAGDVNGDGVSDIAIGTHQADVGGRDRGAFWIVMLDQSGRVRDQLRIGQGEGGFFGPLSRNDTFGHGLARLQADQGVTLAAGAPQDDDGGTDKGALWLLDLKACQPCVADWNENGSLESLDVIAFLNDWVPRDPAADVNGDGDVNTLDMLLFLNLWSAGCD